MPRLATGLWTRPWQSGFTLLEVMVVLVLIGIITGFAVLSMRGSDERERLAVEARRLTALMELSHQEAMLRSESRGVRFTQTGYAFLTRTQDGDWGPVDDSSLLKQYELPPGFSLQLTVEGRSVDLSKPSPLPQVLLLSSGETTEFSVTFNAEYVRGYRVSGDLTGSLSLTSLQ